MKANELRIGNWISTSFLDEERLMIISEIGEFNVVCENKETDAQCGFKVIYPIPLTEEWLAKFGVKWIDETGYGWIDGNYHFKAKKFKNGRIDIWINSNLVNNRKTKYVHQLQNLYFALTGEELKIN